MTEPGRVSSICYNLLCGNNVDGDVSQCPKCGKAMKSSRIVKRLGWLLLGLGLFLVCLLGFISAAMWPLLIEVTNDIKISGAAAQFNGTADQARGVMNLFLLIIGFGALTTINGIYQVATANRSRLLSVAGLLAALWIVVAGVQLYSSLKGG